ncbi:RNA-binding protein, RRM domain protein [Sandaracinus amylolyticus]|nr:RNA-binding protein, RRM domain protein [Sandaracinus amylolyticus]
MPDHDDSKKPRTLTPGDIVTHRLGRRSALGALGASVLGATALIASPAPAEAKASDSDPQDPPGRGRTGFTDRDSGPGADGAGRGVCAERGWSDSDPNDPQGRGRGPCH